MNVDQIIAQQGSNIGLVSRRNKRGLDVHLDAANLAQVLGQMERETQYSQPQIVFFGAKVWLEQAKPITPVAPETVSSHWFWWEERSRWVDLRHWGIDTPITRRMRHRGYAAQSWNEARRKLGAVASGRQYFRGGDVEQHGLMTDRRNHPTDPWIMVASDIPYIMNLDGRSRISATATHNTTVKLLQILTRNARRAMRGTI